MKVIPISDHDHWADYAELQRPWEDPTRFAMRPGISLTFKAFFLWLTKFAVMVGIAWFFVWAAVGGWRTFHHVVDWLMGAL